MMGEWKGLIVMQLVPIAYIETEFTEKFGIPRQSGLVSGLQSVIRFAPGFGSADALRGLADFTHLWLIWGFSQAEGWTPTVRPPRLGGNERCGVFATRSPYRPNPLGLSAVKIERIDGTDIHVSGADLLDGTPIYDIKPYLPYADSIPDATGGFADSAPGAVLRVQIADELAARLPPDKRAVLVQVLALDPRPSYQDDPGRVYGFPFAGYEIKFQVTDSVLTVLDINTILYCSNSPGRADPATYK